MTEVVMPQMGESIAEGTIIRWIKRVGDQVDRDEPLFEISTDKVDAEIPSPAAGVLTEIRAKEGDTVPVNSVVAVIGDGGAARAPAGGTTAPPAAASSAPAAAQPGQPTPQAVGSSDDQDVEAPPVKTAEGTRPPEDTEPQTRDELRRQKSSPLVRRIAREHNIDISDIAGSGLGGRVTKRDILDFVKTGPAPAAGAAPASAAPAAQARGDVAVPTAGTGPTWKAGQNVEVVPMSVMRRKVAEHMVQSLRTSAHVHSVFDVDFTRVAKLREAKKEEYERSGVKLTYLAFIVKATVDALRTMPVLNASIDGDNIAYKKDINIGIAVALDWGLIVPVIAHADEKNLIGLSRAIADLAARARAKQLKPEEVQGGTFTITNPGVFGAQFGMPIINQPQVAIMGIGAIEKRAVVIEDAIGIRPRAYLSLGYDHRLIDGAVADQFMSIVKKRLEEFDSADC